MRQEVRALIEVTFSLDVKIDEEEIGVYLRDGILKGFPEQIALVPADKIIDVIDIKQEGQIYSPDYDMKMLEVEGMELINVVNNLLSLNRTQGVTPEEYEAAEERVQRTLSKFEVRVESIIGAKP